MRKTLLYLEDDAATREATIRLLQCSHIHVDAYGSTEAAAAYLCDQVADIALLDLRLPGQCGDQFAVLLAAHSPATQIIFLTAESNIGHLKAMIPHCRVLAKPAAPDVLRALICSRSACHPDPQACPSLTRPARGG